jgi:hypothetical protein
MMIELEHDDDGQNENESTRGQSRHTTTTE